MLSYLFFQVVDFDYYNIAKAMHTIRGRSGREYKLERVLGQGSFGRVYYSPPYAVKEVAQVQKWVRQALKN